MRVSVTRVTLGAPPGSTEVTHGHRRPAAPPDQRIAAAARWCRSARTRTIATRYAQPSCCRLIPSFQIFVM